MHTPLSSQQIILEQHFPGLQRLISFALSQSDFAAQLMREPEQALIRLPKDISLTQEEQVIVLQSQGATHISDFARRLYANAQAYMQKQHSSAAEEMES
ncbi:MAG: hypothetical protein AAGF95_20040 [Chloroflexota bacterium]